MLARRRSLARRSIRHLPRGNLPRRHLLPRRRALRRGQLLMRVKRWMVTSTCCTRSVKTSSPVRRKSNCNWPSTILAALKWHASAMQPIPWRIMLRRRTKRESNWCASTGRKKCVGNGWLLNRTPTIQMKSMRSSSSSKSNSSSWMITMKA